MEAALGQPLQKHRARARPTAIAMALLSSRKRLSSRNFLLPSSRPRRPTRDLIRQHPTLRPLPNLRQKQQVKQRSPSRLWHHQRKRSSPLQTKRRHLLSRRRKSFKSDPRRQPMLRRTSARKRPLRHPVLQTHRVVPRLPQLPRLQPISNQHHSHRKQLTKRRRTN